MLRGLDGGLLDELAKRGLTTREYIVFGQEWWLYVCNRIAEQPERLFAALADLTA
jgi:proline dehydrogenase